MAFRHGLHGLTNKVGEIAKKFTSGRRFWHGLHGLKIKVLKIQQGWPFINNSDLIFSNPYVAFGHGLHGLTTKVSESAKN